MPHGILPLPSSPMLASLHPDFKNGSTEEGQRHSAQDTAKIPSLFGGLASHLSHPHVQVTYTTARHPFLLCPNLQHHTSSIPGLPTTKPNSTDDNAAGTQPHRVLDPSSFVKTPPYSTDFSTSGAFTRDSRHPALTAQKNLNITEVLHFCFPTDSTLSLSSYPPIRMVTTTFH